MSACVESIAESAECLLLCDVVYEPHLFPLLLATMAELCGPDTLILLAYRRRNPDEWQFFERLAKVRRIQYYSNIIPLYTVL